MKVILFSEDTMIVSNIFNEVYSPKIDRERGQITHSNGKIFGLDKSGHRFTLVEDHIPVEVGEQIDESFLDYDQSHNYDGFTFDDIKEKIEEVGEEIKEEIKGLFGKDDDGEVKK